MQDPSDGLFDCSIRGVIELQQAGKAGLKIRLRAIEAGERNHGIPFPRVWPRLYRFSGFAAPGRRLPE